MAEELNRKRSLVCNKTGPFTQEYYNEDYPYCNFDSLQR